MGVLQLGSVNGRLCFVDSDNPTQPFYNAVEDGGKILFDVSGYWASRAGVLDGITDPGSGIIISAGERLTLHTHANKAFLDAFPIPAAGDVTKALVAIAEGVVAYQTISSSDPNNLGVYTDINALRLEHPTAVAGNYAILTNIGGPASFAVWDPDLGPADWVEVGATQGVVSVNGQPGPVVVLNTDDIGEGAKNLYLTPAEQALIALIPGMQTDISDNTTLATHANRAILDGILALGSGQIISTPERATLLNYRGIHDDLTALQLAIPLGVTGDYAILRDGILATWETTDWVQLYTAPSGGGTVSSVNGQPPDGNGNVQLDTSHINDTSNRRYLTEAERSSIASTNTAAASNSAALARLTNQESVTLPGGSWDASTALNVVVNLVGGTSNTWPLIPNMNTGETAMVLFQQDATGGATVDFSAFRRPQGTSYSLTPAPFAVDIVHVYQSAVGVQHMTLSPDSKL